VSHASSSSKRKIKKKKRKINIKSEKEKKRKIKIVSVQCPITLRLSGGLTGKPCLSVKLNQYLTASNYVVGLVSLKHPTERIAI